uniref:Uncharacterized protein n=1 Tax=Meloidogyne enterolobii TaxID=390850 RepID=A0A6V7VGE1_MELEN|nr:unnamed protein product [Meloidogyne enterolobii]
MEYFKEILNDKEIRKILQKTDGSIYCLYNILGCHHDITEVMKENGLLEVDVLRKDETLTKHYKLYFKALKDSINQRANKIIVDYLLWFRWVDNSVKEKKQWEIQSNCTSMRNVITDTRIFFRTVYGKMLWSDEENIENIEKALVYKMYFLKEYVGVQQKDKLITNENLYDKWVGVWQTITNMEIKAISKELEDNKYKNEFEIKESYIKIQNKFDDWLNGVHYKTLNKFLNDKNSELFKFLPGNFLIYL